MITHICERKKWERAQEEGEYRTVSLETEGFIHCSKPEQVLAVANFLYRDVPDLLLLWIDTTRLVADLRWEAAVDEVYPHLYGSLNLEAVQSVVDFVPDEDGEFRHLPID
ncbi:MAG: DUF952 domain-containing protein [Chloroflexota bacterium]|nr:DUF952 domain-containing protein [Chloroflexota bacterium]